MLTSIHNKFFETQRQPVVSVIICTYNRQNYLDTCIKSVLSQTYKNWELIIVDDGSTDNTFKVVNNYLEKYAAIKYVKHQNIKLALSRNTGLLLATGSFITFLDSDDSFKENHLQSRLNFMIQNPTIDLIHGGVEVEEEIFVVNYFKPEELISIKDCVLGSTFFGKRNVFFEQNGFNNIHYGEDTDFLKRTENIYNVVRIEEPKTYVYNRAENSISKNKTNQLLKK